MGGGVHLRGGWAPILQLDLENWTVILRLLNLIYNILDLVHGLYFPDDPLKTKNILSIAEIL